MHKTPKAIQNEIVDLIRKTPGKFLRSDALTNFLEEVEQNRMADVHPSLNNTDKIRSWIQKEKLLKNPLGQSYDAVVFEYLQHHKAVGDTKYIRQLVNDGTNFRINCFNNRQASKFSAVKSFRIDMTFERVAGEINEVAIATMDETLGSILALARVFVNSDTKVMYEHLFRDLSPLIEEASGAPIWWKHIHGSGVKVVQADMCHKQASGLGHFLNSLDPSFTWQEHIQHVLMFCLVHFRRGIEQKFRNHDCYPLMLRLPTAPKEAILATLCRHRSADVRDWAKHKQIPWVLAGINPISQEWI
jgi:hypothetical protein